MTRVMAVILVGACGGSSVTKPPDPKPAESQLMSATLNGNRVIFTSARAMSKRDGRVVVTVSTHALDCARVGAEKGVEPARDEVVFGLTLVPKLIPGAGFGWRIEGHEFEHSSASFGNSEAIDFVAIDPGPGQHTKFHVAPGKPRHMVSIEETRTLVVWDQVDALGCGPDPRDKWEAPTAEPAKLVVAGREFAFGGAAVADDGNGKRRLVLGTEEVSCGKGANQAILTTIGDFDLELIFAGSKLDRVELSGDWIGEAMGDEYASKAADLKVTGMQWADGADQIELELGGATQVFDERGEGKRAIDVAIRGKVRATVCKNN